MATKNQLSHSALIEKKGQSKKVRRNFERDWSLNLAYLAGEQHVSWDATTGRIFELNIPDGELRTVQNIMLKIHRIEKSKLLKAKPTPVVLPASESQTDVLTARVATAYCKQLLDEWQFDRRLRGAVSWAIATGNVFLKWYWAEGMNRLAIVSPYDIYPDPYARKFYDSRWIIHSQFMDVKAATALYGSMKGADLKHIRVTQTEPFSELEITTFSTLGFGGENLEGVVVNEYYEPPTAQNPEGHYCVFTESGIVFQMAYPFKHRKLPFTHIGHLERPNSLWYGSILDPLRKIQDEVNRTESQVIMNRNLSQGKWVIPMGLELESLPNAEPGQILEVIGGPQGAIPELIQVNSLPDWVSNEVERYKAAMQDIAGQHEVSNAGVPGRVEAAQAIQLLQEQDDSVLRETIDSIEEAVADGFMMSLQLFKQYGKSMDIRVYDKDGNFDKKFFKTDAVDVNQRVTVQTTSGLPQTVAGKWDRVLNLWQYKVLTDPNRVLELLDIAGDAPDLVPQLADKKKAWSENIKMRGSGVVVIKPKKWEDHQVHIDEHKKFMKSPEFDELDEITQKTYEYHLKLHEDWRAVVLQEEAMLMQLMQGGGAPPEDQQMAGQNPLPESQPPGTTAAGSPVPVA